MKYGVEAIVAAGFPHEFAAVVMLKAFELNISLALRVGQSPNANKGFSVSPKPSTIKTKTCCNEQHLPFLAGFIAWNQAIFGRNLSKPVPDNIVKPVQLHVSLSEILRDYEKGEYSQLQIRDNILQFIAPHNQKTADNHIVFSLDLTKGIKPLLLDQTIRNMIAPWEVTKPISQPGCWHAAVGDFNQMVNDLYPVSYQAQGGNRLPLHVVATLDNKPITGDADILWIAVPADHAHENDHHEYNVNDKVQLAKLLTRYEKLVMNVKKSQPKLTKQLLEFVSSVGVITPYELLVEKMVNDDLAKNITHLLNLFQHGPETNNPGSPSPLNGKILHFHEGLPILTENEDELIRFIMRRNYLEKYYIRVHPAWDMSKWGEVVAKQLQLKQPVNRKTLENYQAHLISKSQDNVVPIEAFVKQKNPLLFFKAHACRQSARQKEHIERLQRPLQVVNR